MISLYLFSANRKGLQFFIRLQLIRRFTADIIIYRRFIVGIITLTAGLPSILLFTADLSSVLSFSARLSSALNVTWSILSQCRVRVTLSGSWDYESAGRSPYASSQPLYMVGSPLPARSSAGKNTFSRAASLWAVSNSPIYRRVVARLNGQAEPWPQGWQAPYPLPSLRRSDGWYPPYLFAFCVHFAYKVQPFAR